MNEMKAMTWQPVTSAFTKNLKKTAFFFSLTLALFAPVSTSVAQIAMFSLFFLFLLSGEWDKKWALIKQPVIAIGIALFIWTLIGTLSSQNTLKSTLHFAFKYSKLLALPCLMYFLSDNQKWQKAAFKLAVLGIIFNLVAIYLNYFILPSHLQINFSTATPPAAQTNSLTALIFLLLSFSSVLFAKQTQDNKKRILLLLLAFFGLVGEIYLNTSRTGYLIEFSLIFLSAFYFHRFKGLIYGALICLILFSSAYYFSPVFHTRVRQAIDNISNYIQQTGTGIKQSSAAERLTFYTTCLQIIKNEPTRILFGIGTSSLKVVSATYLKNNHVIKRFANPHNQYLLFLTENGLIGLVLFLAWLYQLFKLARRLIYPYKEILFLATLAFMLGCLLNSWLLDFGIGITFLTYVAILSFYTKPKESAA